MRGRGTAAFEMIALSTLCAGVIAQEKLLGDSLHGQASDGIRFRSENFGDWRGGLFPANDQPLHVQFSRLADHRDIADFGPLSPDPSVRHAGTGGGTGNYPAAEVLAMAFRLALESARRR